NAVTLDTWMDEGKYLTNGYWYFTGKIAPYSTVDPSFYMPLSFYSVAPMEWLFGVGYLPGRVLMIVFALGCLVLAYLTGARTGRSRLAGVSAVVLIVAYPVTLTFFATATPYAMVSCQRHVKPIDLVLGYFWITAILHYLPSLHYCVDCIIPYMNYYLRLGVLAAAGLIEEILPDG